MKRIVWLLILLLLAACSGAAPTLEQPGAAEPGEDVAPTTAVATETVEAGPTTTEDVASVADPVTLAGDPLAVRERDWKLGADEPAVTIIEYGDFQ